MPPPRVCPARIADRAVLRRGQAGAVVELEVARQLELVEVLLVAIAAHLEHEHLLARGRELGGDHRSARTRADHAGVDRQGGALAGDLLDGDRLRCGGRVRRGAGGPRVPDRLPVGVAALLVGEGVEEEQRQRAQLVEPELGVGIAVAEAVHDRGPALDREIHEVLGRERVEQPGERRELVRQHRLGEHLLDLARDAHVGRGARHELALELIAGVDLDGRNVGLAQRCERCTLGLVERRRHHGHGSLLFVGLPLANDPNPRLAYDARPHELRPHRRAAEHPLPGPRLRPERGQAGGRGARPREALSVRDRRQARRARSDGHPVRPGVRRRWRRHPLLRARRRGARAGRLLGGDHARRPHLARHLPDLRRSAPTSRRRSGCPSSARANGSGRSA